MAQGTEQQAKAHHAIADDHHGREYRVAGQRARSLAAGEHQCDDQRGFDHGHGEREDQGAEGLADTQRNHLGVMDRRENRNEQGHDDDTEQQPVERAVPDHRQQEAGDDRQYETPGRCAEDVLVQHSHLRSAVADPLCMKQFSRRDPVLAGLDVDAIRRVAFGRDDAL